MFSGKEAGEQPWRGGVGGRASIEAGGKVSAQQRGQGFGGLEPVPA